MWNHNVWTILQNVFKNVSILTPVDYPDKGAQEHASRWGEGQGTSLFWGGAAPRSLLLLNSREHRVWITHFNA